MLLGNDFYYYFDTITGYTNTAICVKIIVLTILKYRLLSKFAKRVFVVSIVYLPK